MLVGI